MPQMAPMSWTILFLLFTIMLLVISTMNYYSFNQKLPMKTMTLKNKSDSKNWKW